MSSEKKDATKQTNEEEDNNSARKQRICPMAESSSNGSSSSPVTTVHQDHLFPILLFLPVESILLFAITCKKLKTLAYSDYLWESVCRRDWGETAFEAIKSSRGQNPWKKMYQNVYELKRVRSRRLLEDGDGGDLPSPRASHSLNLVSGCLVLFGGGCEGGRHLDDTWVAHAGNDLKRKLKWQKMNAGIPTGRFGHSCVVIDQHLVLFGGINDIGARQNDTWIGQVTIQEDNTITMSWRLLDVGSFACPPPRGAHAGCCMENKGMLIHGGISQSGMRLNDLWILELSEDLSSGTWKEIVCQPFPPRRSGHTLTYIGGSQTVLFGGRGMGYEVLNDVWLLDGSDNRWRWREVLFELQNVPRGWFLPRVGHSANLIIGRRLLIYGGEDSNRNRKNDFWVLDINSLLLDEMPCLKRVARRMWRRIEPDCRPECRSFHGACVDDSGRFLYIHGGMVDGVVQPANPSGLRFDGNSYLVDLLRLP